MVTSIAAREDHFKTGQTDRDHDMELLYRCTASVAAAAALPAAPHYVSSSHINAVVPYEIQGLLSPNVQVVYQGQKSNRFSLAPCATVPALFHVQRFWVGTYLSPQPRPKLQRA